MSKPPAIRRALISVFDKTGIVDFARALHDEFDIEIISTGGTAKTLTGAGIPVTLVEDVTGFPELLDGRVKTLHPKIHAAILADRDNPKHMRQLEQQGIEPIDMVVINLYPFEKTIAKPDCTFEEAIEMIDIGGPCLLRAAAKNHKHVLVEDDLEQYDNVLRVLRGEYIVPDNNRDERRYRAALAFGEISMYDARISEWIGKHESLTHIPWLKSIFSRNWGALRYGENPHQRAELLESFDDSPFCLPTSDARWEDSADISFNNYGDAGAALELCAELTRASEQLWHRRPAGANQGAGSAKQIVAPEEQIVAPASRRWEPVGEERHTRRNLPHIQNPGRTYFITFRTKSHSLPPAARDIVLDACRHWHGKKMNLHIAVVMPDHVHLLLTPYLSESGRAVPLAELLHSIKSFSSHQISRQAELSPPIWLDESWDRIMRHEKEFLETWEYIETNPVRAELGEAYRWVWHSRAGFEESGCLKPDLHRRDAGATERREQHRRDAGATRGATKAAVCCFIKHTNACGCAVDGERIEAYRKAYLGDPNAAMGGNLAVNFDVDLPFAETVMETYSRWGKQAGAGGFFVEVWVAPAFDEAAVEFIRSKKKWGERVRLLEVGDMSVEPDPDEMDYKCIAGGMLVQTRDLVGLDERQWKIVTKRHPTESEWDDLRLAWLICKHTKSNAISICKDGMLIGNGAGQMSRVMSCRIASWLARENGHEEELPGSAAASDAFFPFRDGPQLLIDAGVTALIQPGGSKRDQETIAACDERGVAMIFTGSRHFKH